eukprot:6837322-Prymnesium_polylepis.3
MLYTCDCARRSSAWSRSCCTLSSMVLQALGSNTRRCHLSSSPCRSSSEAHPTPWMNNAKIRGSLAARADDTIRLIIHRVEVADFTHAIRYPRSSDKRSRPARKWAFRAITVASPCLVRALHAVLASLAIQTFPWRLREWVGVRNPLVTGKMASGRKGGMGIPGSIIAAYASARSVACHWQTRCRANDLDVLLRGEQVRAVNLLEE